jgi:hypothetical protein
MIGNYLALDFKENGVRVTLTPMGSDKIKELKEEHPEMLDHQLFAELFTDFGFHLVDPSYLGLTSCQLGFTDDSDLWWHERYAVEDAIEVLQEDGGLFLQLAMP